MPSFITFIDRNYTVYPKNKMNIGDFLIVGSITNKYLSRDFKIKIRVANTPPRFMS
jgi:hypothetical protein